MTFNLFDADHAIVYLLLLMFGLGFNYAVAEMERRKIEGYTWEQVVTGVGVVVFVAGTLIGWLNVLILMVCLGAAGLRGAVHRRLCPAALGTVAD